MADPQELLYSEEYLALAEKVRQAFPKDLEGTCTCDMGKVRIERMMKDAGPLHPHNHDQKCVFRNEFDHRAAALGETYGIKPFDGLDMTSMVYVMLVARSNADCAMSFDALIGKVKRPRKDT